MITMIYKTLRTQKSKLRIIYLKDIMYIGELEIIGSGYIFLISLEGLYEKRNKSERRKQWVHIGMPAVY